MDLKTGDRVAAESESTERPPRFGIVEEVLDPKPSPRFRIRWDDGHESIYTPEAGRSGASPGRQRHHLRSDASPAPTPSRPGRGESGGSPEKL